MKIAWLPPKPQEPLQKILAIFLSLFLETRLIVTFFEEVLPSSKQIND